MDQGFLGILKRVPISFCPNNPHQTARYHIPYVLIKFSRPKAPTIHQAFHRAWHDPLNPKNLKHIDPQRVSYQTMEEKMIHSFLISMAHITPIHQNASLKHKIIQCKDLPMIRCHTKNDTLLGILAFQTPFHGKLEATTPLTIL